MSEGGTNRVLRLRVARDEQRRDACALRDLGALIRSSISESWSSRCARFPQAPTTKTLAGREVRGVAPSRVRDCKREVFPLKRFAKES